MHGSSEGLSTLDATMTNRNGIRRTVGPTAIICTVEEARRFVQNPPAVEAILALTPMVRAELDERGRALCVRDPVTDWGHARIAARALRASQEFLEALDRSAAIRPGTRHALGFSVRIHGYLMGRLWETLRCGGPWFLTDGMRWELVEDRGLAFDRLLDHIRVRDDKRRPPPFTAVYRWLRRLCLYLLRRRGPWAVSRSATFVFGLDDALREELPSLRLAVLNVAKGGWKDYLDLVRFVRDGLKGARVVKFSATATPLPGSRGYVRDALESITEPIVRRGLTQELKDELAALSAECEGLFSEIIEVSQALAPSFYATRQDSGLYAVVSDAMGATNVPRYVINYNSFFVSGAPISDSLSRFFIDARMPSGLSDHYVMWSPILAESSRQVLSPESASAIEPLRIAPPRPADMRRRPGPRRVLHAGNYTELSYFFPWLMETSNEFVDGIVTLAESVADLDDVELTIRTKPKGECVPETLRAFIQETPNCQITWNERPFNEVIPDADLLVAFMSTTIEMAVLHRTPVLLWGPTERHLHFPARKAPPTPDDRAAVYAVTDAGQLAPMITAILEAHTGRPLTDEEIAGYVWPEGTQDVHDLARAIVQRNVQPQVTECLY